MPPSEIRPTPRQLAIESAPGGIISVDDSGRITFANREIHRLLDAAPESLVGAAFDRLLSPAARVFHSTHVFPLLKLRGRVDEIFVEFVKADGERVPTLVSATRTVMEGVGVNHWALLTMTQRKQLEAALVESKRTAEEATAAKDQFLAVISHELRSPLSAIQGWARIGMSDKIDEATRFRAFETIERNAALQARLIDDLLDISRIVSGKMRISPRTIDLGPIIEAAVDAAKPAAQARGIALQTAIDAVPLVIHADPDRIQQVAWNLLTNAIKFTPAGGWVRVLLKRDSSFLRLDVADSGKGIPAADLPFVFQRFWQSKEKAGPAAGLGLGLSICKTLVELHGGDIRAASGGPGGGSTFSVQLPLAVPMAKSLAWSGVTTASDDHPFGISLDGIDVLVVDDNQDAAALLKMLLEAAGASVRTASSYDEALAQLRASVPRLLVSDIGLQGRDGLELIRAVRAGEIPAARSIPAIAVTGMARPQDRVTMLRAGFQAHLTKPIEPSEVTALVQALAGSPRDDRPREGGPAG